MKGRISGGKTVRERSGDEVRERIGRIEARKERQVKVRRVNCFTLKICGEKHLHNAQNACMFA